MLIASMIVRVKPELAQETQSVLDAIPNVTTYGVYRDDSIVTVTEAEELEQFEALSKRLLYENEGVLGVYPTYLTSDDVAELEG